MSMSKRRIIGIATTFLMLLLSVGMNAEAPRKPGAQEPRIIDITAKRFAFAPSSITLKKGETVALHIRSEDVVHGFFSRQLKIDETIDPGKTAEVILTPQTAGTFTTICDHFCGAGHGNMSMTIVVE
jgi:cytochrome c oxidase subunit 2